MLPDVGVGCMPAHSGHQKQLQLDLGDLGDMLRDQVQQAPNYAVYVTLQHLVQHQIQRDIRSMQ